MPKHPNTKRFMEVMTKLNFKKWYHFHPKEDFGQAVRRISEEEGNDEAHDYPSVEAIAIAIRLTKRYGGAWP